MLSEKILAYYNNHPLWSTRYSKDQHRNSKTVIIYVPRYSRAKDWARRRIKAFSLSVYTLYSESNSRK